MRPDYVEAGVLQMPPGSHQVALVVILSIFVGPWVGMLLNGQIAKGLFFGLFGTILVTFMTCGYGLLLWYPVTLIDAILIAQRLNRGEPVREWQFF